MEDYIKVVKVLTNTESILYSGTNGVIVKTILIHNTNLEEKEVTLSIDSVTFIFKLASKETLILDKPIVTNSLKAIGNGINIHISGIKL